MSHARLDLRARQPVTKRGPRKLRAYTVRAGWYAVMTCATPGIGSRVDLDYAPTPRVTYRGTRSVRRPDGKRWSQAGAMRAWEKAHLES